MKNIGLIIFEIRLFNYNKENITEVWKKKYGKYKPNIVSFQKELIFVFVIIKVYDELGCKWENVKTIPLLTKKKASSTTVQHNYYYNNNNNNNNESKTVFCSNCGIPLSYSSINLNQESIPKFCRNCGVFLTNSIPGGFQQKE